MKTKRTGLIVGIVVIIGAAALFVTRSGRANYVAEVMGEKITAEEFKNRYKLYLEHKSTRDNILLRRHILNNMINERLIHADIRRQGFDNDEMCRRRLAEIEAQALLDEYARRISCDVITISEDELWKEFRAYNSKVNARYLYAKTEDEAWRLKEQLDAGVTFERLAKGVFRDPGLANSGGRLGYFGWGEMDPALEEAAFSLPVGAVSEPVRLKIGYAIVEVEDRVENPLASETDYAKSKEKLAQAIHDRKMVQYVKGAVEQIRNDLSPVFNEQAVEYIFDHWNHLVGETSGNLLSEKSVPLSPDVTSQELVSFRGQAMTIGDFLKKLEWTTEKQRKRVRSAGDVKDMCVGLVAREELLRRAKSEALEQNAEVLAQVKRVREEYLLKRWRNSVQDTVGRSGWDETVLRTYYENNRREYVFPPLVNVAEILVRTEEEARSILQQVRRGADFSTLARNHSIRLWAAEQGGELGFGTKANFGILGEKIFSARMGEVVGPERVDPYYGIFKILARKEGRPKTFEEAKDQIIETLTFLRKQEVFKEAIEDLRKRSTFVIDTETLASVVLD